MGPAAGRLARSPVRARHLFPDAEDLGRGAVDGILSSALVPSGSGNPSQATANAGK
jgi:hypothetical protein